jgi:hypothetical protein
LNPILNKCTEIIKKIRVNVKTRPAEKSHGMSENPKNPYLNPSTIYKIGLNLATCAQKSGSIEIE